MTFSRVERSHKKDAPSVNWVLPLTAEQRQRSRQKLSMGNIELGLTLPRGTVLQAGDWLMAETGEWARIEAKPEPVLTAIAKSPMQLVKAAYFLGNRHVPVELGAQYLRLKPDSVLENLLQHLGLTIVNEVQPFSPEPGAYHSSHH
ncbi:MAG: urease accessory protein UreE [Cyanobacteria bacterium P01_H01_bin.15]